MMDRITKRNAHFEAYIPNQELRLRGQLKTAVERLAAYEDTGLHPGQVAELCKHLDTAILLKEAPAADVAPVVHGRLVLERAGDWTSVYTCSECGRRYCVAGDRDKTERFAKEKYPFCNCGAKMDGKE